MADFLDQKRDEIAARLKELGPLVDEYERLQRRSNSTGRYLHADKVASR